MLDGSPGSFIFIVLSCDRHLKSVMCDDCCAEYDGTDGYCHHTDEAAAKENTNLWQKVNSSAAMNCELKFDFNLLTFPSRGSGPRPGWQSYFTFSLPKKILKSEVICWEE